MPVTWNPSDKNARITLSNGNLTGTPDGTGNDQNVRATAAFAGKQYLECRVDASIVGEPWFGILAANNNLNGDQVGPTGCMVLLADGQAGTNGVHPLSPAYDIGSPTSGSIIGLAVDEANDLAWFSLNGTFVGDPAAGTGGIDISHLTRPIRPAIAWWNSTTPLTGRFLAASMTYSPPSGFAAFETAGTSVSPGAGSLTYTGYAPTLLTPSAVTPGAGALAYTGRAPSLSTTSAVQPGAGSLSYTGFAPSLGNSTAVTPGAGSLTYTGHAPSLLTPSIVQPGAGSLTYTGYAPSLFSSGSSVLPGVGRLTYTGYPPTLFPIPPTPPRQIPVTNNLDQVRKIANAILAELQAMAPGYADALPDAASQLDGRLFVNTSDMTLYQVQGGAWVAVDMTP